MTAPTQREIITVRVVRKPKNLHEILCRLEQAGVLEQVIIEARRSMNVHEYDEFVQDFSSPAIGWRAKAARSDTAPHASSK